MSCGICLTAAELILNYLWRDESKSFVILEGPSDIEFWGMHFSSTRCRLWCAGGKSEVMDTITSLSQAPGLAAIVDGDYWLIRQSHQLNAENLLYDGCYPDLEIMLLSSPAVYDIFAAIDHKEDLC